MHDVTLIHPGGGGVVRRSEELVQRTIRNNNLDSWLRVGAMVAFAGWAEIHCARDFNSSEFPESDT